VLVHQAQAFPLTRGEQFDHGLGGGRARGHSPTSKARREDFVYFSVLSAAIGGANAAVWPNI